MKKFFTKPFNSKFKNSNEFEGNSSNGKNLKVELKEEKKDVKSSFENKKELKLKGESSYDCNYNNGLNHLEKDCI